MYYTNFCPAEMHKPGQRCTALIEETANALDGSVVAIMLLAVQKDNMELNINRAVKWYVPMYRWMRMRGIYFHYRAHSAFHGGSGTAERVIKMCIMAFPSVWVSCNTRVLNCLVLKEDRCLVFCQSVLAYHVITSRFFILLVARFILGS
jgi:hypothetical protein